MWWPLALVLCFTSVCFIIRCLLQHSTLMCYSGISASGNQFCFCLSCKVLHLSKLFLNSYGSAPRQLANHRSVCVVLTRVHSIRSRPNFRCFATRAKRHRKGSHRIISQPANVCVTQHSRNMAQLNSKQSITFSIDGILSSGSEEENLRRNSVVCRENSCKIETIPSGRKSTINGESNTTLASNNSKTRLDKESG